MPTLTETPESIWGSDRLAASIVPAPSIAYAQQSSLDDIAASSEETLILYDLALALSSPSDVNNAGDAIARHLRRLVPASIVVIFSYDVHTDDLVSVYVTGDALGHFLGLRIPRGERLSGWVAANRLTLLNSDPVLDFGDVVRHMTPRLRSSLSAPLVSGDELVGVLSIYAGEPDAFNEEHKRIIDAISTQLATAVKNPPTPNPLWQLTSELQTMAFQIGNVWRCYMQRPGREWKTARVYPSSTSQSPPAGVGLGLLWSRSVI